MDRTFNLFQEQADQLDLVALLAALVETQTVKDHLRSRAAYKDWLAARISASDDEDRALRLTQYL